MFARIPTHRDGDLEAGRFLHGRRIDKDDLKDRLAGGRDLFFEDRQSPGKRFRYQSILHFVAVKALYLGILSPCPWDLSP